MHLPRRQLVSRRNSPQGFTLNEILTSTVIFVILAAMVIANFRRGQLSDDLRISTQTFTGHLRRVQNLSTVGQTLADGTVPPGGYGISIAWAPDENDYTLFADTFDASCAPSNPGSANSEYDAACDPLAETGNVRLRPSVVFDRIKVDATNVAFGDGSWDDDGRVDIAFKPPKPLPVTDGATGKTVRIQLRHTKTNEVRTVTIIGASGQVSERLGGIQ